MQKIRVDFDNPGLPQHISAVENDSQSRFFQATLYENGKAYTAPAGASYSIMYHGFGPQNQGWYDTINDNAGKRAACAVSGNVVTCEIARQALQVPGYVSIVLCVTTGKGYMLKSWPIECDCKNDHYDSTVEIQSFFYITQVSNADWNRAIQALEDLKNTIDPTLSLSGKAADAKETGDKIGELKEDIDDFKSMGYLENVRLDKSTWVSGYTNSNGKLTSDDGWKRTDYINVSEVKNYFVTFRLAGYNLVYTCAFFDTQRKFISGSKADSVKTTLNIPKNASYVVFSSANDESFKLSDIYAEIPKRAIKPKKAVVMIGDSYGIQNTDNDVAKFYWEYLRDSLELTEKYNFFHQYRVGAGFGNNGFLEQLQALNSSITNKNDITDIIVCGGWNDSDISQSYGSDAAFNTGILAFNKYVKTTYPNATITVAHVGWALYSDNAFYIKMNRSINRYIKASNLYGWRYIVKSEYILRERGKIWQSDGAHPNNEGQKILGENLVSSFLTGGYDVTDINQLYVIGTKKIKFNSDGTITWENIK